MRRQRSLTASLLSVGLILTLPALVRAADQPTPPGAPSALAMALPGTNTSVIAGSWINSARLDLHFHLDVAGTPLTPQVELESANVAFTGTPNFTGAALNASGTATVTATGLNDREGYHWQARAMDNSGNAGPWVAFSTSTSTPDVSVDRGAPSRPVISSSTNPDPNRWYNGRIVILHWDSKDALSGVKGYTFKLEHSAHVIKPGSVTSGTGLKISNIGDGIWFLLLRSVDRAGNWSATATFRFLLDRQTPQLRWLSPRNRCSIRIAGPLPSSSPPPRTRRSSSACIESGASFRCLALPSRR